MEFPQYRKYENDLSYFKIIAADRFTELKFMGSKYQLIEKVATVYPDRVFINDLLEVISPYTKVISEQEFEEKLDYATKSLQLLDLKGF